MLNRTLHGHKCYYTSMLIRIHVKGVPINKSLESDIENKLDFLKKHMFKLF